MPKAISNEQYSAFREKLCRVALRVFAERGVDALTMRELAMALGVSPMTPYRYFRDKDEILAAMRARAFTRFAEALETAYDGSGSLVDRAAAKRDAYIRFALENPASYRLMFDLSQSNIKKYPELAQASERARATMVNHIADQVAAGDIQGDPERIAHVLWAMLHGAVSLHLADKLSPNVSVKALVEEASTILRQGLLYGRRQAVSADPAPEGSVAEPPSHAKA